MNRDQLPETPAELHDLLRELFGVGNYDDVASTDPWFRARMTEIAKVKGMLRRRRVTVRQVAIAAWYAHDNAIPVPGAWKVFTLVSDAMKDLRRQERGNRESGLLSRRNAAVIEAMEQSEQTWAERLLNASDRDIDAVIDQWRNR